MYLKLFTQFLNKNDLKLDSKNIALIAMMVAVIETCKMAIAFLPNIELTSFLLIMFTLYFGAKILYVIPVFILIEGVIFGIGPWWIMYLYAWPILVILTLFIQKKESAFALAMLSGIFGLLFGAMCSLVYLVAGGPYAAISWWIAGIPWDLVHGISNFIIMLVLYKPMKHILNKTNTILYES